VRKLLVNTYSTDEIIKKDKDIYSSKPYVCYIIEADQNGDIPNDIYIYHLVGQEGAEHDYTFKYNKDSSCSLTGDNVGGTAFCIFKKLFEKNEQPYYNCLYNIVGDSVNIDGYGNLNYIIFGKYISGII